MNIFTKFLLPCIYSTQYKMSVKQVVLVQVLQVRQYLILTTFKLPATNAFRLAVAQPFHNNKLLGIYLLSQYLVRFSYRNTRGLI